MTATIIYTQITRTPPRFPRSARPAAAGSVAGKERRTVSTRLVCQAVVLEDRFFVAGPQFAVGVDRGCVFDLLLVVAAQSVVLKPQLARIAQPTPVASAAPADSIFATAPEPS
jgi:hypothetical protein